MVLGVVEERPPIASFPKWDFVYSHAFVDKCSLSNY